MKRLQTVANKYRYGCTLKSRKNFSSSPSIAKEMKSTMPDPAHFANMKQYNMYNHTHKLSEQANIQSLGLYAYEGY